MTKQQKIETLYQQGRLPRWAYNQLNGKSASANYTETKRYLNSDLRTQSSEAELEEEIIAKVESILDKLFSR